MYFSQSIQADVQIGKNTTPHPSKSSLIYSTRNRFLAGHLLDLFENASLMTRVLGKDGEVVVVDTSGAKDGVGQVIRGMWG